MSRKEREDTIRGTESVERYTPFINALNTTGRMLDEFGLDRGSWMVISGGATFLYQLTRRRTRIDRIPTDLDVLIDSSQGADVLNRLNEAGTGYFQTLSLRTEPRKHFGHSLTGPILETISDGGFPIDFMVDMSQIVSPDYRSAFRSANYTFPRSERLFTLARSITHPSIEGKVTVAHPGFIAFYKLLMARETGGKQDSSDRIRLKRMGLMRPSDHLDEVIRIMISGFAENSVGYNDHPRMPNVILQETLDEFGYEGRASAFRDDILRRSDGLFERDSITFRQALLEKKGKTPPFSDILNNQFTKITRLLERNRENVPHTLRDSVPYLSTIILGLDLEQDMFGTDALPATILLAQRYEGMLSPREQTASINPDERVVKDLYQVAEEMITAGLIHKLPSKKGEHIVYLSGKVDPLLSPILIQAPGL